MKWFLRSQRALNQCRREAPACAVYSGGAVGGTKNISALSVKPVKSVMNQNVSGGGLARTITAIDRKPCLAIFPPRGGVDNLERLLVAPC